MIKILLHGCNGKMGQLISEMIQNEEGLVIAAGIDPAGIHMFDYPVYESLDRCNEKADVVLDFTHAKTFDKLIEYCVENEISLVTGTTGFSSEQLDKMKTAAKKIAILHSSNMSVGMNVLFSLIREAARKLGDEGFDIEIVERHHNQKLDAPSGTALVMADTVNEALGGKYEYVYDRSQKREKRSENEIGISAVRGGTIVGNHEVIFAGDDEVITLEHCAYSRKNLVRGAFKGVRFIVGKEPAVYSMQDVIEG